MLQAEPAPLEIDLKRTAVIVIDMQHSFVSKGGLFDKWGVRVPGEKIFAPIRKITETAREKGIRVIYVAHSYSPDLSDSGGPDSPNWYKRVHKDYREHPEWRDSMHFTGSWGAEIAEEVQPHPDDIFITKSRYSAFPGTRLDIMLKTFGVKYLAFLGVATNICVETSARDAFALGYFPILVSDATLPTGPEFTQEATEYNIKRCFGWVTDTASVLKAME